MQNSIVLKQFHPTNITPKTEIGTDYLGQKEMP